MQYQSTLTARVNARTLRKEMTDGERRLWSRLRGEQLGVKFRRQHPFGNYIADFACLERRVIVELDGSQHQGQIAYDQQRDQFFSSHGFAVLRFHANEPFVNIDGVLTLIAAAVGTAGSPHPGLPPEGEGERQNRSHP